MHKKILNNIVPADDLHWCEEEERYVSLSREEIDEVISSCIDQGMPKLEDIYKVIQWCGRVRVGQILWSNMLSGSIIVAGFDEHDEPMFMPRKENKDED